MPAFNFGLAKETRFSFLGPMFLEGHCKKFGGFVRENHYTSLDYAYDIVDYGMGNTQGIKWPYEELCIFRAQISFVSSEASRTGRKGHHPLLITVEVVYTLSSELNAHCINT